MNIRTLSIYSFLLVANLIQCGEITLEKTTEELQQEEDYAIYLELTKLQLQYQNSPEVQDMLFALQENNVALMLLGLEKQKCNISNDCSTSKSLIEAFHKSNQTAIKTLQLAKKAEAVKLNQQIQDLQQKHQ